MSLADSPVPVWAELWPWPKQGEVDVEQHGLEHRIEDRSPLQLERRRIATIRGSSAAALQGSPRSRNPHSQIPTPARLIGVPRFELGASPTRTERATRLRHTPSANRVPARRARPRAVRGPDEQQYAQGVKDVLARRGGWPASAPNDPEPDERANRAGGLFVCRRTRPWGGSMANHLTPEELAKEMGMDRDEVVRICVEEGVPIYHGKIDKTLFQASLEAVGAGAASTSS